MERIEKVLECAVCLDRLKEPKMLPCQHTFCLRPCLQNVVQNNSVCCPECRARYLLPRNGVEGLPANLTIVRLLDLPNPQPSEPEPPAAETDVNSYATEALLRYRNKGQVKTCFGTEGNSAGRMNHPCGISCTSSDEIVVADTFNSRIQIFDVNGQLKGVLGSLGESEGQFFHVYDVCVTSHGSIVASDMYHHRIEIFDEHGRFVRTFGSQGSGDGQLSFPWGVATDDRGLIYVCDKDNHRVQVFSATGQFVRKFGSDCLDLPMYLSVTSNGRVVVGDFLGQRVRSFDEYGRHLFQLGANELVGPQGIATDQHGNIIVVDSDWNNQVKIFTSDGSFVSEFGRFGSFVSREMRGLEGVCLLSDGGIVVSDYDNHTLQIF